MPPAHGSENLWSPGAPALFANKQRFLSVQRWAHPQPLSPEQHVVLVWGTGPVQHGHLHRSHDPGKALSSSWHEKLRQNFRHPCSFWKEIAFKDREDVFSQAGNIPELHGNLNFVYLKLKGFLFPFLFRCIFLFLLWGTFFYLGHMHASFEKDKPCGVLLSY